MRSVTLGRRVFWKIGTKMYESVALGVCFSSTKGNHFVFLGLEGDLRDQRNSPIRLIEAGGHERLEGFLQQVSALQAKHDCYEDIHGPTPPGVARYVANFNKRPGQESVVIREPSFLESNGDLSYYLERLFDKLTPQRRTLFVEENDDITRALRAVSREIEVVRDVDNPLVGALCFAVEAVESRAQSRYARLNPDTPKIEPSGRGFPWQHQRHRR